MRFRSLVLATLAAAGLSAAPAERLPYPEHEVANVAAFARLYGVARYFYPSDAAAALDWERFAVLGVSRARYAKDAAGLRNTLLRLFSPLGPGFEVASRLPAPNAASGNGPLVAWRYLGPGRESTGGFGPYRAKRTGRYVPTIDGFVTVMQNVPAEALRGKTVRLRGRVRAEVGDATGAAALWLRVDRPGEQTGFFDNMSDRPVRQSSWRDCVLEGPVASDAANVAFGAMASGAATAEFDALALEAKGSDGAWAPVAIADGGFEEEIATTGKGWFRAGNSRTARVQRPSGGTGGGRRLLRLSPHGDSGEPRELVPDAPPKAGAHADVPLGQGLFARVPLALADGEARTGEARRRALDALLAAVAAVPAPGAESRPEERMADVVAAWSVFRHFFPYFSETGVDWDARLVPALDAARLAASREEQRTVLRRLVAEARDGHGLVSDGLDTNLRASLPVRFLPVAGRLVVAASAVEEVPVGAVVSAIDGAPAAKRLAEGSSHFSGSDRWRQVQAAATLAQGASGTRVSLAVDDGKGTRTVALAFDRKEPPPERRPAPVVEIGPGTWYVDLTRAATKDVAPRLAEIAAARAVVFDVRGYPLDAGMKVLPHLLDAAETDRWMHVARVVGPFGEAAGWNSFGWNLAPEKPRIGGKAVFLTDARAISYAESVMGYVADRKLGTIVGSATAGTNGNVASMTTPGRFVVGFTGMRVTRHDGKTAFHLAGVAPDVAASPTVEGLRAGRDEVLEKGLAVARAAP